MITAELKPKNKADETARARFVAHSVSAHLRMQLRNVLQAHGTTDEPGNSTLETPTKKLAVVSLHLAALEQGGTENPAWFVDFIFAAMRQLDRMTEQPTSRSLIELHGQWVRDEIISGVVSNALSGVKTAEKDQVAQQLTEHLNSDQAYRAELLDFALTQPIAMLEEHQSLFDIPAV